MVEDTKICPCCGRGRMTAGARVNVRVLGLLAVLAGLLLPATAPALPAEGPTAPLSVLLVNTDQGLQPSRSYHSLVKALGGLSVPVKVTTVHYTEVNPEFLAARAPDLLVLGPQGTPWWEYAPGSLDAVQAAIRSARMPVLGICGGHQLLAMTYGGDVAPIECPVDARGYEGCVRQKGFFKTRLDLPDPVFDRLEDGFVVRQNHAEHVTRLPQGFIVLASSPVSPVQAMRAALAPVYGFQFHPEAFTEIYDDGRRILDNFLQLVVSIRSTGAFLPGPRAVAPPVPAAGSPGGP